MRRKTWIKTLCLTLCLCLAASFTLPGTAFAEQPVWLEQHSAQDGSKETLSGLRISGIAAPQAGQTLDDTATVSSAEGADWDVPVLWINEGLQTVTEAAEGKAVLPAIAFFVPGEYAVQSADEFDEGFTVMLDDEVELLFGTGGILSVYDAATGITYITPDALASFFTHGGKAPNQAVPGLPEDLQAWDYGDPIDYYGSDEPEDFDPDEALGPWDDGPQDPSQGDVLTHLVNIHCSQTAKDAMSMEELGRITDMIINKLQPQAVNLLLNKFPAFGAAADKGELGKQMGLYIYYGKGDNDGISVHSDTPPSALAYVSGNYWISDSYLYYGEMMGVDLKSFTERDETGQVVLSGSAKTLADFDNTIIHEMLHGVMDDYNRVGMSGAVNPLNLFTGMSDNTQEENLLLYQQTRFPTWFIEGLASAVENVYQYRSDSFQLLSYGGPDSIEESYTSQNLLNSYTTRQFTTGGTTSTLFFDLEDAVKSDEAAVASRYVTGYLASLYLGDLAAQKLGNGSSIQLNEGNNITGISSENIRAGVNSILEQLHNGKTLDAVIAEISDGRYSSTDDFEKKFIKGDGESNPDQSGQIAYQGDNDSLAFCTSFLNYMRSLKNQEGRNQPPNGSILFDFDQDFATPLDRGDTASSGYFQIVDSNERVVSTVDLRGALESGGKSLTGQGVHPLGEANVSGQEDESELPAAAREEIAEEPEAVEESETVEAPEIVEEPEAVEEPAADGAAEIALFPYDEMAAAA